MAVVGAVLVFGIVFMVFDFFAMRMTEGAPPRFVYGAMAIAALIAFIAAASSYRASMR